MLSATALLALGSGCISLSMAQTARAVDEGKLRAGVATTMVVQTPPGGGSQTTIAVPVPEVTLRYGLGGGADLGFKGGPLGTTLDFKKELFNTGGVVFAVEPFGGFLYASNLATTGSSGSSTMALNGGLSLLLGFELGAGHEVVLGPKLQEYATISSGGSFTGSGNNTQGALLFGGGLGIAFKISDLVRVMPEVNFATKLAGDGQNGGSGFQFGIGVMVGGR